MGEKTYAGGCHCGAVRFEVDMELKGGMVCNCSICHRTGWVLTFVPATSFRLLSGQDGLRDYQFNKRHVHHVFCATCGVRSFSRGARPDGTEMIAVNLRCVDDVDLATLPTQPFDGRSL